MLRFLKACSLSILTWLKFFFNEVSAQNCDSQDFPFRIHGHFHQGPLKPTWDLGWGEGGVGWMVVAYTGIYPSDPFGSEWLMLDSQTTRTLQLRSQILEHAWTVSLTSFERTTVIYSDTMEFHGCASPWDCLHHILARAFAPCQPCADISMLFAYLCAWLCYSADALHVYDFGHATYFYTKYFLWHLCLHTGNFNIMKYIGAEISDCPYAGALLKCKLWINVGGPQEIQTLDPDRSRAHPNLWSRIIWIVWPRHAAYPGHMKDATRMYCICKAYPRGIL